MSTLTMRSFRSSTALRFVSSTLRRSASVSFGLRRGFLAARPAAPWGPELQAPRREERAVDAFTLERRFEIASLAGRQAGVRLLDDAQLVGRAEDPVWSRRDRLQRDRGPGGRCSRGSAAARSWEGRHDQNFGLAWARSAIHSPPIGTQVSRESCLIQDPRLTLGVPAQSRLLFKRCRGSIS